MSFTDHVEAHWTRPYRLPIGFPDQLCDREFACLVDGREQVQLICTTLDFDNIDVKKSRWSSVRLGKTFIRNWRLLIRRTYGVLQSGMTDTLERPALY